MKNSFVASFILILSAVLPAWGTQMKTPKYDRKKPLGCESKDLFIAKCVHCTVVSSLEGKACTCNSLTKGETEMIDNQSKEYKKMYKAYVNEIKEKCKETFRCTCKNDCGGAGGDPHFRTLDGVLYSYHGECDLVMARSPSYGSGVGLDMHARTAIVNDWSLISNLAVRIGDDIFEVANDGNHYLNGESNVDLPIMLAGKYQVKKGEDVIESFDQNDGKDITQVMYAIELDNDEKILISEFKQMISVSVQGSIEGTHGMLGTYGLTGLIGRDGVTEHTDFNRMGADWQVNRETEPNLFHEIGSGPQYPEQCKLPEVTGRRLRVHSEQFRQRATSACANASSDLVNKCVEDVLWTGDIGIAHGYAF